MNLMKILSIIISKTVHNLVKLVKGSTSHIGGVIALKIDKNILKKLQKPEIIITVTGTNGKTTVTNLATDLLELLINEQKLREELKSKKKPIERTSIDIEDIKKNKRLYVISNKAGSNLKAGIVDNLITNSNIFRKIKEK